MVQPAHGAFPELIRATGGGVLGVPDSSDALVAAFRELMEQPQKREELGRKGTQVVHQRYGDDTMAEQTLKLYRRTLDNRGGV